MTTFTSTNVYLTIGGRLLVPPPGVLADPAARLAFVLAGNATFTVLNPQTEKRFTFKVKQGKKRKPHPDNPHFVSVLTGPDNEHDYEFIGTVFDRRRFQPSRRSAMPQTAPSVAAFAWIWERIAASRDIAPAVLYHEGHCGRCGRLLTVPESVSSGIGPECHKKVK